MKVFLAWFAARLQRFTPGSSSLEPSALVFVLFSFTSAPVESICAGCSRRVWPVGGDMLSHSSSSCIFIQHQSVFLFFTEQNVDEFNQNRLNHVDFSSSNVLDNFRLWDSFCFLGFWGGKWRNIDVFFPSWIGGIFRFFLFLIWWV